MLNNYQYFIALAEELNISKAAERLFISHQCLSKYLKTLEEEYGVAFFERTPRLSLTDAGRLYLNMLRQIQLLESNLDSQLNDILHSRKGVIRFGTTEGRYRILLPQLLSEYKRIYPQVDLVARCADSHQLWESIAKNELDLALLNRRDAGSHQYDQQMALNEQLYLVISDHLLAQYFPESYPKCKKTLQAGANLADFARRGVPFVLNCRGFNSRETLETYLSAKGITLKCVMEMTQQDIHCMLAARDFAACFCWAMYLHSIQQTNESGIQHLNVFPIQGLTATNQVMLIMPKGKILPEYGKDLVRLIQQTCTAFISL